jgi:hypothetical protein
VFLSVVEAAPLSHVDGSQMENSWAVAYLVGHFLDDTENLVLGQSLSF